MDLPFLSSGDGSALLTQKVELKAITTRCGLVLDEHSSSIPPPFIFQRRMKRILGFLKPLVLAVFVLRSQELQILSFILGIRYPNLID
ncbi:hypothetical protein Tco_1376372 [Tanacetum coccineum]